MVLCVCFRLCCLTYLFVTHIFVFVFVFAVVSSLCNVMPQFDESFLSDCALADRWRFYSYTLKQLPGDPKAARASRATRDDEHHHQPQHQRQSWSPRDSNNNSNISNTSGNTLHSIKFHRRRKYKKLARLALSTPAIPLAMDATATAPALALGLVPPKNALLLCRK